jgi:hypothetical protein
MRRWGLVGLLILVLMAISFGSFKYGQNQSNQAQRDVALDEKLAAAFAIQSVKLLLVANEKMSIGNVEDSREALITHLGDSLYFVGKGLSENNRAYVDIGRSLCSRQPQITKVIATLSEEKPANDEQSRLNKQARQRQFAEGLAEIEKHCQATKKEQ